ncbi:MAG: UDP-N-acetylglucosamine 1-carboxyvinyltransferase [Pseudomonadota bacterium]
MEKLVINGGKELHGTVKVSGAKNAALPIMAASLLSTGNHRLKNIPQLRDIQTMKRLLEHNGAIIESDADGMNISTGKFNTNEAPYDLVKTMRASVLVLGPLIAMLRRARVSLPGGCAIGARPINLHLAALEKMGTKIELKEGYVELFARHLHGAEIEFELVTVTGTENIMMAASLADGVTTLKNAALEPEVVDLANYLKSMGAKIEGAGTDTIRIEGVDKLHPAEHSIIPDRIEAGSLAVAVALCGGEVKIINFPYNFLETPVNRLREAGVDVEKCDDGVIVKRTGNLKSVDIITSPYPGFPTDLQAQFMTLMTKAKGISRIEETIFENRFMHVQELARMGAKIDTDGGLATVIGQNELTGAPVMATDLRASVSLVIAALAAKGTSEIHRIYHLDRGYERIEEKLTKLGADIKRVK